MRAAMIAVLAMVACGGTDVSPGTDSGTAPGVRGTGPTDGGGVWALAAPCTATDVSACPFTDAGGTCYTSTATPRLFCGLPGPCPAGSDWGTAANVGICLKQCGGAADCPAFTNCYKSFCIPN